MEEPAAAVAVVSKHEAAAVWECCEAAHNTDCVTALWEVSREHARPPDTSNFFIDTFKVKYCCSSNY